MFLFEECETMHFKVNNISAFNASAETQWLYVCQFTVFEAAEHDAEGESLTPLFSIALKESLLPWYW